MSHQGYTARIDFDDRDGIFVGRLLGIRHLISFHADNVGGLRSAFHAAVQDYLDDCAAQGVSPEKPASGKLLLRVSPQVHAQALVASQAAGMSLNQWVGEALQRAIEAAGER